VTTDHWALNRYVYSVCCCVRN